MSQTVAPNGPTSATTATLARSDIIWTYCLLEDCREDPEWCGHDQQAIAAGVIAAYLGLNAPILDPRSGGTSSIPPRSRAAAHPTGSPPEPPTGPVRPEAGPVGPSPRGGA